ncbi:DUF262 domain-containing protein [Fusobacterium ulcerans]|uniref:DUF262 domain-containing protein n=1 Tax=Fusobacterium ulcerans TaxID=861 RepID=UPI001D0BC921|nr:DUF262 domain-containing protein [Fusobacterium ulcerans]MCB8566302.1 hypothetical protein [Fusobacterium ulcerans]MCB8650395.1 hypothetical protein [Fusobacterium ulcerans]
MPNIDSEIRDYLKNRSIPEDDEVIRSFVNLAAYYNRLFSESRVGDFLDIENYESTFYSGIYFEDFFVFVIELFLKHSKGHYFHNGNKRTAVKLFENIISNDTPYQIKNYEELEKIQLNYVNDEIDKNIAINKIKENLVIKEISKTDKVKLELLVKRGEVTEENYISQNNTTQITLNNLMYSDLIYKRLRKPYFQRDTNSWSVERIKQLINTFKEEMLIPSVILWDSRADGIFIVDGAHRLSALIAWVNDDYGKTTDYKKHIQIKKYIDETVGNFNELKNSTDPKHEQLLNILAMKAIHIQWIIGNYNLVKASFIRINEQGVTISLDEKELIKNDETAIAKLSRNILSYVGGQNKVIQKNDLDDIHEKLFMPKYNKNNNIYPMCGDIYDNFLISRIFKLIKVIDNEKNYEYDDLLKQFKEIINLITEQLELNNRVYFYGINSQYKESALCGIPKFILSLINKNELKKFIDNRGKFEQYLIENPEHIQQIIRKHREVQKSLKSLEKYYLLLLNSIEKEDMDILIKEFSFLKKEKLTGRTKSITEKYHNEIRALRKCRFCGGYINNYSIKDIHEICRELENKK